MKHKHRIVPGHMGGEYVDGNVIEVEVAKCDKNTANHTMWHYANWRLWNKKEDYLAWKGLSGFLGKEEIIQEVQRLRAEKCGAIAVERGLGIHSPEGKTQETCRKGGEETLRRKTGMFSQTEEEWSETRSKGGKKSKEEGKGIFSQTKEQLRKLGEESGNKTKQEGKGIFSINKEDARKNSSEGGRKSASTLWMDPLHPEVGSHPANLLALKQKRLGMPHSPENRVKVSQQDGM